MKKQRELLLDMPGRQIELGLPGPVGGVDEVGRGSLCASVVAAAVILPGFPDDDIPSELLGVTDSKALSARRRTYFSEKIRALCHVGIGEATHIEIDQVGILKATFMAMERAVAALPVRPYHVLIDGNQKPPNLPMPSTTVIKGDRVSLAIAAASIVAKVYRDQAMVELDALYPGYGMARNAGYPTASHMAAIERIGPSEIHRRSFNLIRQPDLFDV